MAEEQNQQPTETQDTQESEKEKKGKTVMVVIIIALVLVIGGGIYAVYTATTSQAPPVESEEEQVTEVMEEVVEEVMEATDEAEATEAGEATEAAEPEEEGSDDEAMIKEALLAELGLAEDEVVITFNVVAAVQAKGSVKEVGAVSGGYYLAAKDGGKWVIVYNGQANPPCADVNKYDFSTSLVPECMDAEDNLVVR